MIVEEAIKKLVQGRNLTSEEAEGAMMEIMSGEVSHTKIAAFLTALRMKGETVGEIVAFARVMRNLCEKVRPNVDGKLVDTCGTGGDKLKTFNISTAAMFVAAGAGIPIAKHGNRSVTSKAGSADVLEALGVNIMLGPREVERCIERVRLGFMFAPLFHKAMKNVMPVRKELGIKTVFNILGPLTNPADVRAQVIGVPEAELTEKIAMALRELGCEKAMVVYGLDGLDEISTIGKTKISLLQDGLITTRIVEPEEFGLKRTKPEFLSGGDAEENAKIIVRVLMGEDKIREDIVVLNAAAAIFVGNLADDMISAVEMARNSIKSGKALEKLEMFVEETGGDCERVRRLIDGISG
ncbi:MAG: anthranilate phosphoribosyltransferase [Candidatus Hadarchaeales archaeon]